MNCKICGLALDYCKSQGCWFKRCKGYIHEDGGYHCCAGTNRVAELEGEHENRCEMR